MSKMSKPPQHSPGPWTYDGESVWDADNCYVCSRVTPGNGRVIAAAPDMLRLLRAILKNHRAADYGGMIKSLGAAAQFVERLDGEQP